MCARYAKGVCLVTPNTEQGGGGGEGATWIAFSSPKTQSVPNVYGVIIFSHQQKKIWVSLWNFQSLQGFVWQAIQAWLGGKSCFSHINPFNFWRELQPLLLKYKAENLQVI